MNTANILRRWFTGKARLNAEVALRLLADSIAQGGWLPKASVKVGAALSKANVVARLARQYRTSLESVNHYMVNGQYDRKIADLNRLNPGRSGRRLAQDMTYGNFRSVQGIDFAAIGIAAPSWLLCVINDAHDWAIDMAPVAAAMDRLDASRPVPTFTSLGLSPTVTATLAGMGLRDTVGATIRPCPIRWVERERVDPKTGRNVYWKVGYLDLPAGTVRDASHHARGNRCHACGHLIKNPYNWCPLLADDTAGTPYLLMVGRDCAENLFGVKMTGKLELGE